MREFLAVVAIIGLLFVAAFSTAGPSADPPPTTVTSQGQFVILTQERRTIHVRRSAVTGFAVYPKGFEGTGRPVMVVMMGAREFRLDLPPATIGDVVKAFTEPPDDQN